MNFSLRPLLISIAIAIAGVALYFGTWWNDPPNVPVEFEASSADYRSPLRVENLGWLGAGTPGDSWKPRRDLPAWPVPDPMDWGADPFDDRNWLSQLEAWRVIDSALSAFYRKGEASPLADAIPMVLAWGPHYRRADEMAKRRMDLNAGQRSLRLSLLIDAFRTGGVDLTDSERDELFDLAKDHAEYLQRPGVMTLNNHGIFEVAGLGRLCEVAADQSWCADGHRVAEEHFDRLVDSQFDEHGVHREHAPSYHFFALTVIERLNLVDLFESGRGRERIELAEEMMGWLVYPDGRYIEVGDSSGQGERLANAANHTACLNADDCYAISPTWRSGYGIVRTLPDEADDEASMLFMMGMRYSLVHKHADDLSFELIEAGRKLLVDSGMYGYENDEYRVYTSSDVAHNTVGLADHAFHPQDLQPFGSALSEPRIENDAFVMAGKIERADLFTQSRTLTYRPSRSLIVRDDLSSDEQRVYASRLHFDRSLNVELEETTAFADLGSGRRMRVDLLDEDCTLSMHRGEKDPHRGWQGGDEYLEIHPTTMVEAQCPGTNRSVTWLVTFNERERARILSSL